MVKWHIVAISLFVKDFKKDININKSSKLSSNLSIYVVLFT